MSPNAALRQAYAKAPKGFSKHILRDLGTSAMPEWSATIQPHVTCLQVDPFWDTRLRFRMYTVFRASVWRFTKVHQTSAFEFSKTSMSDNSNLSGENQSQAKPWLLMDMFLVSAGRSSGSHVLNHMFQTGLLCVLWVPNSERHCDSLFAEVGSLFKIPTDEKVWQHFLQRQKNLSNKWNIQEIQMALNGTSPFLTYLIYGHK